MRRSWEVNSRRAALLLVLVLLLASPLAGRVGAQAPGLTETFDDPALPGWEHSPGVHVADGVLHLEPGTFAFHPGEWEDFTLTLRLRLSGEGGLAIGYRTGDAGTYHLLLTGGHLAVQRETGSDIAELAAAEAPVPRGEWFQVDVTVADGQHTVALEGEPVLTAADPDPLPPGGGVFETLGEMSAEFDELTLTPAGGEAGPEETPPPAQTAPPPAAATSGAPAYQSLPWVYLGGPLGGLGYDVRMRPDDPDVMFVTDAWAGVFKSTDGGQTWFPSNSGITTRVGPSGDGIPVFSLTIDPNNPDRVWIGTQYSRSVYRSDDGGATWVEMSNGIQERGPTIRGFAVEPGNSDVVYLAGEVSSWEWNGEPLPGLGLDMVKGIVYKTTDGGQHWERIWYGDNLARYIWIHPQDHDLIYVSSGIFDREAANSDPNGPDPGGVGILRSHDGGQTWEVLGVENGFRADELYFGSLYMHPTNPGILLAAAGNDPYMTALGRPIGAVYRTEDGGDTWQRVLDLPNGSGIEICEGDPNVAYAASLSAFFRSEDGGQTWRLQAGVGEGEVVWTGDELWGPPGVVAGFPIDLQCDPRNSDRVFVNAYGGGNFVSEDGGQTWRVASTGYSGALMFQIAMARDDPARVYATARSGIFASNDSGRSWEGLSYGPARAMEALAIGVDPQDPQHIIASVGDASPFPKLSYDGGHTWRDVGMELAEIGMQGTATRVRFSPTDPRIVLISVGAGDCVTNGEDCEEPGGGIVISHDGGETWERTNLDDRQVVNMVFSADGSRAYATVYERRIYRSDDGGQTWELVCPDAGAFMPPSFDQDMPRSAPTALAVDPTNPDKVYVGFIRGGIAISHDGGVTWEPSSSGVEPEASVRAIVVDPTNPDVVYAGTSESGVYLSTDGGQTWQKLNAGLLTRTVRDLALSADGRVLYMASEGGGAFRLGTPGEGAPEEAAPTEPVATKATETPVSPTPASPEDGTICGGAAALPLALIGLAWMQRRRR
ncbi:MAG: family 16 glycoside hydrolase [Anaerolineae bacterium]